MPLRHAGFLPDTSAILQTSTQVKMAAWPSRTPRCVTRHRITGPDLVVTRVVWYTPAAMKVSRILDAGRVALNVRIPPDLYRDLRVHCLKNNLLIRDFLADCLSEALARTSKGPKRGKARA